MGNCKSEKSIENQIKRNEHNKKIKLTKPSKSNISYEEIQNIQFAIQSVKYTKDTSHLYLLPKSWFNLLLKFKDGDDVSILNVVDIKEIYGKNIDVIGVIYEIMFSIIKIFVVNSIYKLKVANNVEEYKWEINSNINELEFIDNYQQLNMENGSFYDGNDVNIESTYQNIKMISKIETKYESKNISVNFYLRNKKLA